MTGSQPELFPPMPAAIGAPGPAQRQWRFANVDEWVRGWLAPMCLTELARDTTRSWCPKWWAHPIALERLTVVWHQYELAVQRKDLKTEFLHELDYQLDTLWSSPGPFMFCQTPTLDMEGGHEQYRPPDLEQAPEGMLGTPAAPARPTSPDEW